MIGLLVALLLCVGPDPIPAPAAVVPPLLAAQEWALTRLGPAQYACLDAIVERESRWDPTARNRSSGAFGLPQGIGLTTTDPRMQLAWMIRYVDRRYGSACKAWAFWQGHRWY